MYDTQRQHIMQYAFWRVPDSKWGLSPWTIRPPRRRMMRIRRAFLAGVALPRQPANTGRDRL